MSTGGVSQAGTLRERYLNRETSIATRVPWKARQSSSGCRERNAPVHNLKHFSLLVVQLSTPLRKARGPATGSRRGETMMRMADNVEEDLEPGSMHRLPVTLPGPSAGIQHAPYPHGSYTK